MPKERTPEEGVPLTEKVKRHFRGSSGDIELPNLSGRRDRRLPDRPDVLGAFKEAKRGLKKVREISGRR